MPFFSSPPPPPPPPPAPAPFLASLLEDPQAAVASLLESVVEYVNDPQFSIWTTASGEPNAWPYVAVALVTTLVLGRLLKAQQTSSLPASPTRRSVHSRAAAMAANDMLASLNDQEPYLTSALGGAVAKLAGHVKEEQMIEAGATLSRIDATLKQYPSKVKETEKALEAKLVNTDGVPVAAALVRSKYASAKDAVRDLNMTEGWTLAVENSVAKTYTRPDAQRDDVLWTKTEGLLAGGVRCQDVLAIWRETPLFHHWMPMCAASKMLKKVTHIDQLFWFMCRGLTNTDAVMEAYGIDAIDALGAVLICAKSSKQADWPDDAFPDPPRYGGIRVVLSALHILVEPVVDENGDDAVRAVMVMASDLSVMPLPTFLIKFMLKHVVGLLFGAQANCARKMAEAAATGAPNPHNAAIAADDFYSGFVNPKVNARIAKLKEEAGR